MVFTSIQEPKIINKPITVEVTTFLPLWSIAGLLPAKRNIIPPTVNVIAAMPATIFKIRTQILLSNTKKWQSLQGFPAPPQGTNPCPYVSMGKIVKKIKIRIEAINIFFIYFVPPEGIEPPSLRPKRSTLSVKLRGQLPAGRFGYFIRNDN